MKKFSIILLIIILLFITTTNINAKSFITLPNQINLVGKKIYQEQNRFIKMKEKNNFYFENKNFYNSITGLLTTNGKKIIDISSHQKDINWDITRRFVDGVILRIGYGSKNIDKNFEQNIIEIKKYNIPYGIYLYSYAENRWDTLEENKFILKIINDYNLNPKLGIYYDIEEFYMNNQKIKISSETYDKIIDEFISFFHNKRYFNIGIYTNNRFYKYNINRESKKYVRWIAQYNCYFNWQNNFKIWQFTDKGAIPGISTNVDINVMFN
ncbi:MAG: GH25 family lysozyme [Bacilli bacterium]|nr:GH25 family lysozyme [Bacilli bacterium]